MADVTMVNGQITDAITQTSVTALGSAPGLTLAQLYQASAQALAQAGFASVHAQQQQFMLAQAATVTGITALYAAAAAGPVVPSAPLEA
ncbi:RebB family R body protein [Sphingomonas sp. R-74633]|uniref:RebB family R body protein n=1 Tax=Sphingomonas sp. R-74633 TaxID=2751188 RepID=UPI0015D3B218|nr:RebB family R body protein [Sphingomonas sp. R-74633]NYT43071.1 RebB family R body protein [Sphingomonas sp. R-74633]